MGAGAAKKIDTEPKPAELKVPSEYSTLPSVLSKAKITIQPAIHPPDLATRSERYGASSGRRHGQAIVRGR